MSDDNQLAANKSELLPHLAHPELHHYTNKAGLDGILQSQEIWATHYKYLNDSTEILHFGQRVISILANRLVPFFQDMNRQINRNTRRALKRQGAELVNATREAAKTVDIAYKVAFQGKNTVPIAVPYIVSFCSHAKDAPYEQEHGLLSQWNRYGGDVGFAIVFDTKKLSNLLHLENAIYEYEPLNFFDVIYNTENPFSQETASFNREFESLIADFELLTKSRILNKRYNPGETLGPFLNGCVRFKHRGFIEEREVRIFASPGTAEFREILDRELPEFPRSQKKLKTLMLKPNQTPYISLFDFSDRPRLPIKRIIVGPHRDQALYVNMIKAVSQNRFGVAASETPFINNRS